MTEILHLRVSPRAERSWSRQVGDQLIFRLAALPGTCVTTRDLAAEPPPHPNGRFARSSLMPADERGPPEDADLPYSERLIGELMLAEALVIDTPMNNFTVPSSLKAWIDYVVRPARTFRSSPAGKIGMLAPHPVFVVVACGGPLSGSAGAQEDHFSPYLAYVLTCIGLAPPSILRLEGLNRGEAAISAAMAGVDGFINAAEQRLAALPALHRP